MNASVGPTSSFERQLIESASAESARTGCHRIQALQKLAQLEDGEFVTVLASALGATAVTMADLDGLSARFDLLPFSEMLQREALLMARDGEGLLLILSDPYDARTVAWIDSHIAEPVRLAVAHRKDVTAWLARQEASLKAMESLVGPAEGAAASDDPVEELSFRGISAGGSPVIKLVNSTVFDAVRANASDIHLESHATGMSIKYRVDGVLVQVGGIPSMELAEQTISRIKVMAELDIAERRIPQDGRFRVSLDGRLIDLRVSVMPSIHGEDAVLRILDKQSLSDQMKGLQLSALGFEPEMAGLLRRLAGEPYGMLLVTGPTGSGKTTTLYAAISEINSGTEKIVTIEDPVEYQLPGVLQIPVNEKKGLTFARGLRSILRHDPDKIMVGEIRDPETAQIAIQSALTGHLVFTTVHANNVFDVIGRFMHMGIDLYSLVAALNGVLAQRLVRVICSHCAVAIDPEEDMLRVSGLTVEAVRGWNLMEGQGCGHCRGSGYRGRKAIAEVLHLNDEIRELIVSRAPIRALKEAARKAGTRYLREAALDLVRSGHTTLAEINRVTFVA